MTPARSYSDSRRSNATHAGEGRWPGVRGRRQCFGQLELASCVEPDPRALALQNSPPAALIRASPFRACSTPRRRSGRPRSAPSRLAPRRSTDRSWYTTRPGAMVTRRPPFADRPVKPPAPGEPCQGSTPLAREASRGPTAPASWREATAPPACSSLRTRSRGALREPAPAMGFACSCHVPLSGRSAMPRQPRASGAAPDAADRASPRPRVRSSGAPLRGPAWTTEVHGPALALRRRARGRRCLRRRAGSAGAAGAEAPKYRLTAGCTGIVMPRNPLRFEILAPWALPAGR